MLGTITIPQNNFKFYLIVDLLFDIIKTLPVCFMFILPVLYVFLKVVLNG